MKKSSSNSTIYKNANEISKNKVIDEETSKKEKFSKKVISLEGLDSFKGNASKEQKEKFKLEFIKSFLSDDHINDLKENQ